MNHNDRKSENINADIAKVLQESGFLRNSDRIEPISGFSASHRHYFRIQSSGEDSVILCLDNQLSEKMLEKFKVIDDLFTQLPVKIPSLIHADTRLKFLLREDAGKLSLQQLISESGDKSKTFTEFTENKVLPLYKKIWAFEDEDLPDLDSFALSKFFFEWEFHTNSQLVQNFIQRKLAPGFWEIIISRLFQYFSRSLQTNAVPIHRDFQSSNLFLKDDHLYVIDFQDMYLGHPLYDPVSWIFDSYIDLPLDFRFQYLDNIILKYAPQIDELRETDQLKQEGLFLVIQRKLHDAGAFVFANEQLNANYFLPYIKPAIQMAAAAAERLNDKTLILFTRALQFPEQEDQTRGVFW